LIRRGAAGPSLSVLGSNERGETFHAVVPAGCWFGATVDHPENFALVGCTVAPGFDFADFEMAERDVLVRQFPAQRRLIERLTRHPEGCRT
jgi:predicted cupin superfamily sugar epimerase